MRKIAVLIALVALVGFFAPTAWADSDIKGKWEVNGTTGNGAKYKGTVRVVEWWGTKWAYGSYYLADGEGERIATFYSPAKFDGKNLTFKFYISQIPGMIESLEGLNNGRRTLGDRKRVEAKYGLSEDGKSFSGGWSTTSGDFKGRGTWTRESKKMEVTGVSPKTIDADVKEVVADINGKNFPDKADLKPGDIVFLKDGEADGKIKVAEILEVSDDGSRIKVKLVVEADVAKGKRDVKVKEATGKELVEIERPAVKMPLGGSTEVTPTSVVKLFIPNKEGGTITINGPIKVIYKGSENGEKVEKTEDGKFEVEKGGWYYIDLSKAGGEAAVTSISNSYVVKAETPKEKKPWNFWYFPYYEKRDGMNLYDKGGVYEKLDKAFGIKGEEDGWKKYNVFEHIDWWTKSSYVRNKLFKPYYEANGGEEWEKLIEKREGLIELSKKIDNTTDGEEKKKLQDEFDKGLREYREKYRELSRNPKQPEWSDEEKKLYNPTTMQGYAYCYQRSVDSSKSWWGHCWGSVVASSLWAQPSAKKIKGADGKEYSFSEEEVEGIITAYYTDHSVSPINYMNDCPPGRPSDEKNEKVDSYCDDYFIGLLIGIKQNGLPLASNLRASSTSESKKDQVWNHVVWKFEAKMKEVADKGDETFVEVTLKVYATDDIYPSTEGKSRIETYVFTLKYNKDGSIDRDNLEYQNWISTTHFCPSYLWRISRSSSPSKTNNALLRGKIDKLVEMFEYKRIK